MLALAAHGAAAELRREAGDEQQLEPERELVGLRRVALRVQGEYPGLYRAMVTAGARVRWTDLRMALGGYEERKSGGGVVLSNWEI